MTERPERRIAVRRLLGRHFLDPQQYSLVGIYLVLLIISIFAAYRSEQVYRRQGSINAHQAVQIRKVARLSKQNLVFAKQNRTAVTGLCLLRDDLGKRIAASTKQISRSEQFLREHPNGIPGIPASLIREGLKSQMLVLNGQIRTLKALDVVKCHVKERK
jgi:hypothetical protein